MKTTSISGMSGHGSIKLSLRKSIIWRTSAFTCHSSPTLSKNLMSIGAGSPRFTSSWVNIPARARFRTSSDRSVAVKSIVHPASCRPHS